MPAHAAPARDGAEQDNPTLEDRVSELERGVATLLIPMAYDHAEKLEDLRNASMLNSVAIICLSLSLILASRKV
jgi:hypothetical protein